MENQRIFNTESERRQYDAQLNSMYEGLVFTENGMSLRSRGDVIAHMTSIFLKQGIEPKFTSGGEIAIAASRDFANRYRKRIDALIKGRVSISRISGILSLILILPYDS